MSIGKPKGKLYYVRLKTSCGVLYKIGFTRLESVEKRLGYGGSRDAQLIDRVFLFLELDDAYQVEQELHKLLYRKTAFAKYSNNSIFPLCQNGQTELFIEDVLKMDSNFTVEQAKASALNIHSKQSYTVSGSLLIDKIVNIFLVILLSPITLLSSIMSAKKSGETEAKLVEDQVKLERIICEIKQNHQMINGEALCAEDHSKGKAFDSTETASESKKRVEAEIIADTLRAAIRARAKAGLTDDSIRTDDEITSEDHVEGKPVDSTETEADRAKLRSKHMGKLKGELLKARRCTSDFEASAEQKSKSVYIALQRLRSFQTEADMIADRESLIKRHEPYMQKFTGSSKVGEELSDEFETMAGADQPNINMLAISVRDVLRSARFLPLGYSLDDVIDNGQFAEWGKYNKLFDEGRLTKDEFIAMLQVLDKT